MEKRTLIPRILFLCYMLIIAYLLFSTLQGLPSVQRKIWGFETDKLVHFIMFFPYPVLLYFALGKIISNGWKSILVLFLIFISGCVFAAASEIIQGFTDYRTADILDFRADAISLAISSLIVFIINLIRRK